jgi:nucleoside-diphosphate-sugar epimerase
MLLALGHEVYALVRNSQNSGLPIHGRLTLFQANILDLSSLHAGVAGCDAVLHLATAIPKPGTAVDWERNTAIRTAGTSNLLKVAAQAGARRYIQQSIALVYESAGDAWVTETSATAPPTPITAPVRNMEAQVMASQLEWLILRGGIFYGPGTGRMFDWNKLALEERLTVPGDGGGYLSLVHVKDMASAVVAALEVSARSAIVNVVDDEPITYRELFDYVARLHNCARAATGGPPIFPSLRVSNRRAKNLLGWAPRYQSYRDGWSSGSSPSTNVRK